MVERRKWWLTQLITKGSSFCFAFETCSGAGISCVLPGSFSAKHFLHTDLIFCLFLACPSFDKLHRHVEVVHGTDSQTSGAKTSPRIWIPNCYWRAHTKTWELVKQILWMLQIALWFWEGKRTGIKWAILKFLVTFGSLNDPHHRSFVWGEAALEGVCSHLILQSLLGDVENFVLPEEEQVLIPGSCSSSISSC